MIFTRQLATLIDSGLPLLRSLNVLANQERDKVMKKTIDKLADSVAHFGGSWTFIMVFGGILVGWMIINTVILSSPKNFDPYPFILLNLVLSTLAALQAPLIMMSQNRQAEKDRMQAQQDYEINLMAEVEIRDLHDKLDALRYKQWHELWHLQQRQIELLELLHVAVKQPEMAIDPPPFAPPEI